MFAHQTSSGYQAWSGIHGTATGSGYGEGELVFSVGGSTAGNLDVVWEALRIDDAGHVTPGGDNTQNLGATNKRWANIYSADLQLSNEGKEGGNEVDGSTGNWTVQEGDENLFVINRKTGKKFKIDLTEV
jgi:hypothetical protein